MSRELTLLVVVVFFVTIFISSGSEAQWAPEGLIVTDAPGSQSWNNSAPEPGGGALISWIDLSGSKHKVYVQKLSPQGEKLWGAGISVSADTFSQDYPGVISDGAGGCFVAWNENRDSQNRIYVQKIDENGVRQWGTGGVAVCTAMTSQYNPDIVLDGSGGAIVAWVNSYTGSPTSDDIFVQRIGSGGSRVWVDTGVLVCNESGVQKNISMVSDGSGGALIFWQDRRVASDDIYGMRINSGGSCTWTANGVAIGPGSGYQVYPAAVADGQGGAFVVWQSDMYSSEDIMFNKVDSTGALYSGWSYGGYCVCCDTTDQYFPVAVSDGEGGIIVSWDDSRNNGSIYAVRATAYGSDIWEDNGVMLSYNQAKSPFDLVCDGDGGAVAVWTDKNDIPVAQRIDRNGNLRWGQEGVGITENVGFTTGTELVPCGNGSTIAVYRREMYSEVNIFAQRIDRHGVWGMPAPMMLSADDVPNDQGGSVLISWERSYRDDYTYSEINHYSVWRRLEGMESAPYMSGISESVELTDIGEGFQGPGVRIVESHTGLSAWEWVKNVDALMLQEYSFAAPTYCDSIAGDSCAHLFQVAAHREDPLVFWVSEPISGYSVDNLAPDTLLGVTGIQVESPAGVRLEWQANTEPDLSHYNIYKNNGSDFEPSPSNLLGSTDSEHIVDNGWDPEDNTFYRIAAVDLHGNIGPSGLLSPQEIEYVATILQSHESYIDGERIVVSWTLSEAEEGMSFRASRASSESNLFLPLKENRIEADGLNYSLIDEDLIPGEQYRYRVEVTDSEGTRVLFESALIKVPEKELTLNQNFPNPFNPVTEIIYYLPNPCRVRLEIFDISGRSVATLVDRVQGRGEKSVRWSGRTGTGEPVSTGVYFCRLTAGREEHSIKMVLLR